MSDARYRYRANYIPDFTEFRKQVLSKTVVPHQVEIQPGPTGGSICWLQCPYCYGRSASDTGKRLSRERWMKILAEIAAGGVKKIIFAGYATDPLHAAYIEDLVEIAIRHDLVVGFNTKALRVSPRLTELLCSADVAPQSYMSVSVDAGSNAVYNAIHAVGNDSAQLYDRVRENVARLAAGRNRRLFEVAATYLVNRLNANEAEIRRFVADFRRAGCDIIRFTYAQLPRSGDAATLAMTVPDDGECIQYTYWLRPLVAELNSETCRVLFVDADRDYAVFRKARTTPCVARFVFPAVGFDGWLYPCSQSAAPNFRQLALGNLAERNFWDCFYDYDPARLLRYLDESVWAMAEVNCHCDRKGHLVNVGVARSEVFVGMPAECAW